MKRIRDFKAPIDAASAAELRRQLGQFEENVSDALDERNAARHGHPVLNREARPSERIMLTPGQSCGFVTATGNCHATLAKPAAQYAGKSVVVYKRNAANFLILQADRSTITGAATYSIGNPGRYEVFCDGTEYWL
jgi:hypothetical protein